MTLLYYDDQQFSLHSLDMTSSWMTRSTSIDKMRVNFSRVERILDSDSRDPRRLLRVIFTIRMIFGSFSWWEDALHVVVIILELVWLPFDADGLPASRIDLRILPWPTSGALFIKRISRCHGLQAKEGELDVRKWVNGSRGYKRTYVSIVTSIMEMVEIGYLQKGTHSGEAASFATVTFESSKEVAGIDNVDTFCWRTSFGEIVWNVLDGCFKLA